SRSFLGACLGSLVLGGILLLRSSLLLGGLFSRVAVFVFRHQLFLGDRLVGHVNLGEQLVDDLLFEDRRAQRCGSARRVAEVIEDFLLLARELLQLREERALHFVFGDFNAALLADLGENEAETDAALGKLAIFDARFF